MPFGSTYPSDLRVRQYNPASPAQSKPIRPEEWKKHETHIRALHAAKYKRTEALALLRADCGCSPNCSFSPSPSQYSTQLKLWGLRTYKPKGALPTHSGRRDVNHLLRSSGETGPSLPAHQVYSESDLLPVPETQSNPHDRTFGPKPFSVDLIPVLESLEGGGVNDDQRQAAIAAVHRESFLVNEASPATRELNDDVHSERSLPRPWGGQPRQNAGRAYPRLASCETVQDAVRRVVQSLSEVLADSELEEFFDTLTDSELDELLVKDVKLDGARNDALLKHTGKLFRVGEFFGPRPTRLVEIRDAIERRARSLYSSTPKTASVESDQSVMGLTTSTSLEQSPATGYGDSPERAPIALIYDADAEMQQELEVFVVMDNVHDSEDLVNMPKNESVSCSACVATPSVEYKVSDDSLRLWSEVNSRQDRFKALDEIRVLAGCFFAARLYADAFDLYFIIWTEFGLSWLDKLAAAINCARTSATPSQTSCVEAILHHVLNNYPKDHFPSKSPQDLLRESMLHSFLGDLYGNLKMKTNAEAHTSKAMLHLDGNEIEILQTSFTDYPHIIASLKSQIANRQRYVAQASGYNASTVSVDDISKSFATELRNNAFLEDLLAWCAKTIHENARGLDAFRSVLPKQPVEQRGFICRTLLCYFIERWMSERQRSSSTKDPITLKVLAGFAGPVSPSEALSTTAMLIVNDCPDQHRPLPPAGRQPSSGILSSALLKNIKELMKSKSNYRSFSEVYLSLMAAPGEVRRQPVDRKSRTMLCQFMMNIAPTSLVNPHLPSRDVGSHNSLVPSPDLFREFEIRPASWSSRLYSPRSSYSSGLNSVRATATKTLMNSILSLAKRQSNTSVTAMSTTSYHSSWSFGAVTGMPRDSSALSDGGMMEHEAVTIDGEPQDEEMLDS